MAKIENTTAYPTVTPSADDLLIATDTSNNNETVTFLVGAITGGGPLQGLQSVLDTGNIATQTMDLTGDINLLGGPGVGFLETCQIKLAGGYGTAGQVITSQGAGSCAIWDNAAAASCCSLDDTLTIGNTSSQDIILSSGQFQANGAGGGVVISTPSVLTNSGTSSFTGQVNINSTTLNFNATALLNDGGGSVGTPGQFLTSTGTGVAWSSTLPPASCCSLQSTIAAGNTSTGQNVTLSGTGLWSFGATVSIESDATNIWNGINTFSATSVLDLDGPIEDSVGSQGLAGYLLTSTGAGATVWAPPAAGAQDLQSVLDIGNTATGVNANITISGFIKPGTIQDTSGAIGAAGQYLTSTGAGLAWVTAPGCCSLDDTLTVGATSAQSITLTGGGTYFGPLGVFTQLQDDLGGTGLAGQVLTVNGGATGFTWTTGGGAGVTSVTSGAAGTSTGTVTTITPTTGAVIVTPNAYNGTSNVGHVPAGGSASTFLRGDGTWVTPSGGAVIDVDETAPGTSVGTPIVVNPTTGNVLVQSMAYNGGTNVGHVPSGGTLATEYLDGTGNWSVPAGGGGAVTSVTQGTPGVSTGILTPLTITPTTGAVVVDSNVYDGADNVGHVPRGGTPTTFLRGDGSWATGAGGVTSVTLGASVVSAGPPLVILPTTGAVVISPQIYGGASLLGFVPAGGAAGTYLEGDGTWSTPSGGAGLMMNSSTFKFNAVKTVVSYTNWSSLPGPMDADFFSWVYGLTHVEALDPTTYDHSRLKSNSYYENTHQGACHDTTACETVCSMDVSWVFQSASSPLSGTFVVYKYDPCNEDESGIELFATCNFSTEPAGEPPVGQGCCEMELSSVPGVTTLQPGWALGFYIYWNMEGDDHQISLMVNHSIKSFFKDCAVP